MLLVQVIPHNFLSRALAVPVVIERTSLAYLSPPACTFEVIDFGFVDFIDKDIIWKSSIVFCTDKSLKLGMWQISNRGIRIRTIWP